MPEIISTQRKCPICDSPYAEKLYTYHSMAEQFYKKLPDVFDIVSCTDCGFIYYDILASQELYDDYYNNYNVYESLGVSYGQRDENIAELYDLRADEVAEFVDKNSSVLDIGCSNGLFLDALHEKGYTNLCGMDIPPKCVENVRQKGFEAYVGSLLTENEKLFGRFDCITLTQVLEHIYDINGAMVNIKRMLKPDGYLYIEVPDCSRYHLFAHHGLIHFQYEHILHFDPVSLENLAHKHGFIVERIIQRDAKFSTDEPVMAYVSIVLRQNKSFYKKGNAKSNVLLFIEQSKKQGNKVTAEFIKTNEPIAVWGIGTSAIFSLNEDLGKCNIHYLIDSNPLKQGLQLNGRIIKAPIALKEEGFKGRILITSALYQNDIIKQISSMGLNNEYIIF